MSSKSYIKLGDIFNGWEVISESDTLPDQRKQWIIKCEHGKTKTCQTTFIKQKLRNCNITDCLYRIGQKRFSLTIISERYKNSNGIYKIRVRCDCGNEKELFCQSLKTTQSCGCKNKKLFQIGDKIAEWTVIQESFSDKGIMKSLCQCSCGQKQIVENRSLNNTLEGKMNHRTTSCGCTRRVDIYAQYLRTIERGAKGRGLELSITATDIKELLEKQNHKCALSGLDIQLSNTYNAQTKNSVNDASIDRIDSSKGYTIDNIQWVNKYINFMKQDINQGDFINFCHIISNHQKDKNNEI